MVNESESEQERLDPKPEACFKALSELVEEELAARITFGDDPTTPEGRKILSELVADAVLDVFTVRKRDQPRYRWT
jgi:hypothetical protein